MLQAELAEFEEAEDFSLEPRQSSSQSLALGHRLGGAFNLPSPSLSAPGQTGQQQPSLANNRFPVQANRQGKLGSAFSNVDSSHSLEFPQQNAIQNLFSGSGSSFQNFPQAPQLSSQGRKTFGTAFNIKSQADVIGPQPQAQPLLPSLNTEVELISQECHHLGLGPGRDYCHHY